MRPKNTLGPRLYPGFRIFIVRRALNLSATTTMPFDPEYYKQFAHYKVTEIETGVVSVQLNNAKTLNAFAEQDWQDYHDIFTTLDQDPDTNIIIVSLCVPKAFSLGLNLKAAMDLMLNPEGNPPTQVKGLYNHIKDFQWCIGTPARIKTPTIGLLNGVSYGLALDMAACYTIRVCTEDVKFSIREIKIGICADIGSLQRLPLVTGNRSLLNKLALTGEVWGHQVATQLGLVLHVAKNLDEGFEYCKELACDIGLNKQWAIKGTKLALQQMSDGATVEQGLEHIARWNSEHITGDFIGDMAKVKL